MQADSVFDEILSFLPKPRVGYVLLQNPDTTSEKVRRLKFDLKAYATLDRKIALVIKRVKELHPSERETFLLLFKQSLVRDFILSGFTVFLGMVMLKHVFDIKSDSKLFKFSVVSAGTASIGFGGKTIGDAYILYNVVEDLLNQIRREKIVKRGQKWRK